MAETPTVWLPAGQVNTTDNDNDSQRQGKAVTLPNGNILVVWIDEASGNRVLVGRLHDFLGNPLGGEINLDATFGNMQQLAFDVCALPEGFAIAYAAFSSGVYSIRSSRFTVAGALVHDKLIAGNIPAAAAFDASVTPVFFGFSGAYQVGFATREPDNTLGVFARNVDFNGSLGSNAGIGVGASDQNMPAESVTLPATGNIVTVFSHAVGSNYDIRVNIRQSDGDPVAAFTAGTGGDSFTSYQVAALTGGGFALAWCLPDGDSSGYGVVVAIYNATGGVVKAAFNPYDDTITNLNQITPGVVALADGSFFVTWSSHPGGGDPSHLGQRFDAAGNEVGDQIEIAGELPFAAGALDMHLLDDGRIAIVKPRVVVPGGSVVDEDVDMLILDPRGAVIDGTAGFDKIAARREGGAVNGFAGNDTIVGGNAADTIDGGTGDDSMTGAGGNDVFVVDSTGDVVSELSTTGSGKDIIRTSVSLAALAANVENATAFGFGGVSITGNNLVNALSGNTAANTFSGAGGSDLLSTGGGHDKLQGGLGADTLAGGNGSDQFIYGALAEAGDIITDFSPLGGSNNDLFKFRGTAFGGLPAGPIAANRFEANATGIATQTTTRFVFETDTKELYFDANGSASGGFTLVATLQAGATMTADDIAIF